MEVIIETQHICWPVLEPSWWPRRFPCTNLLKNECGLQGSETCHKVQLSVQGQSVMAGILSYELDGQRVKDFGILARGSL